MANSVEEFQARAEACRVAAAAAALDKVRQLHLSAAARWEVLAAEARWSPAVAERPSAEGTAAARRAIPLAVARHDREETLVVRSVRTQMVQSVPSAAAGPSPGPKRTSGPDRSTATTVAVVTEDRPLPDAAHSAGETISLFAEDGSLRTLDQIEAEVIRLALATYKGRISTVARHLGIGRSTLYRKIDELRIELR